MASLIDAAKALATAERNRPSQPYLRRAISTAYYAVFDALALQCADMFIGGGAARRLPEWSQVFRALDHGPVKNACSQLGKLGTFPSLISFADTFVALQEERLRADYDPASRYSREDARNLIKEAERAIRELAGAPKFERRAFLVLLSFKKRA